MNLNEVMDIDLPNLLSINLGSYSLFGRAYETCSLTMRSNNELIGNN